MTIPPGYRFSGIHSGIKQASTAEDISLIVADTPCVAAAVYTQNQVVAAPVILDRQRTPSNTIQAIIVNSGNANACTGDEGMRNAERMLACTANATNLKSDQVLVMSTGIIGEQLPMECIESGISAAAQQLGNTNDHFAAAARGILTTDTKTKTRFSEAADASFRLAGMAKGSGMIGPNMATMLASIITDAPLPIDAAQSMLAEAVRGSFNSINVDGHTSTNDTVILLANGDNEPLKGDAVAEFERHLNDICIDLAKQIVEDGEGATHLVEIQVHGAATKLDAEAICRAIANSPLVKTAIAGNDPNWGRIVSAAGYAGPPIDVQKTTLKLNGVTLYDAGVPVSFDVKAVSESMANRRNVDIELTVGKGSGTATYWTCDLTHDYVTINAEYHT